MSLWGVLSIPAKQLPYANLAIDLVMGGPSLMFEAATGLASAFIWNYIRRARAPSGGSLQSRPNMDALLVKYIQPYLVTPPRLRQLLVGNMRTRATSYGAAYAPTTGSSQNRTWNLSGLWPFQSRGQTTGTTRLGGRSTGLPDRDAIRAATEARVQPGKGEK